MKTSSYWIVKGNKNNLSIDDRDGDIVQQMRAIIDGTDLSPNWWIQRAKATEPNFRAGEVVLAWRSRQKIGIVGIGVVQKIEKYEDEVRFMWNPIQCFDSQFISISEIKSALQISPEVNDKNPQFIKPSVMKTVYSIDQQQARCMKALIQHKIHLHKSAQDLLDKLDR